MTKRPPIVRNKVTGNNLRGELYHVAFKSSATFVWNVASKEALKDVTPIN